MEAELVEPEALLTLECDLCSESFTGKVSGQGSATFLLGSHKYRAHGIRGSKKKGQATTEADHAARPVTSTLIDMANDIGGKGAPSAHDLTKALGRGVGLTTVAVAAYFVETDETIPFTPDGEAHREHLVDELSLSRQGAEELMAPIGRLIHPTGVNRRYGRTIVDNVDAVAAFAELVTLGLRWRRAFRERNVRQGVIGGIDPIVQAPGTVVAPSHTPTAATVPVTPMPDVPITSPAPQSGVIVGPEMVDDMRRRRVANG